MRTDGYISTFYEKLDVWTFLRSVTADAQTRVWFNSESCDTYILNILKWNYIDNMTNIFNYLTSLEEGPNRNLGTRA